MQNKILYKFLDGMNVRFYICLGISKSYTVVTMFTLSFN